MMEECRSERGTVKTGNFAVGEVISPWAKKIFGADG
jgi:hypothetical protein